MKRLFVGSILLTILVMGAQAQSDAVTVLPNGNVGINNSNPSKPFDVKGDVKVDGTLYVVYKGKLIELG